MTVGSALTRAAAGWQRPSVRILVLAQIGAILLAVVAVYGWPNHGDEDAYWRAAERLVRGDLLYDPAAPTNTGGAYWYPPVLVQALAPLTLLISSDVFRLLWTLVLVGCVWILAGRNVFVALACVAFVPVALELSIRNVHLLIALLVFLALRRSWVFLVPAVALKLAPVFGVVYLLAAGRRREAVLVLGFGVVVLAVSMLLAPSAWAGFVGVVIVRAPADGGTFVSLPYPLRLGAGVVLASLAGRRGGRAGEVGLVIAITVASPTLWANAFSQLLAILPLLRVPRAVQEGRHPEPALERPAIAP